MKRQVDATAYLSGKISLHLLRGTGTFSIGLDRKFRRGEHRATSIRVNAKSRSTPGRQKGWDAWKATLTPLLLDMNERFEDQPPIQRSKNSSNALCGPDIIHEFSCTGLPSYTRARGVLSRGRIRYNGFPRNWNLTQWIQWRIILIYIFVNLI